MNIEKVTNTLKDINYSGGYYNIFLIKDPKYRIIMSLNIHDKIINHYITKYFLYLKIRYEKILLFNKP